MTSRNPKKSLVIYPNPIRFAGDCNGSSPSAAPEASLMANGKSSDPSDYVLRSGVRSGLKREFAFALKSRADLPNSFGRTRSGRVVAPADSPSRLRKKPKKPDVTDEKQLLSPSSLPTLLEDTSICAVSTPSEGVTDEVSIVDTREEGCPESDAWLLADSIEGLEKDGLHLDALNFAGSNDGLNDNVTEEKPVVIYRRSVPKDKLDCSEKTPPPPLPQPSLPLQPISVVQKLLINNGEDKENSHGLENGSAKERPRVSRGCNVSRFDNGAVEKPIRRFTRSALKVMPVTAAPITIDHEEDPVEVIPVSTTSLTAEHEDNLMEVPVIVDERGGVEFENGDLNWSMKSEIEGSVAVAIAALTDDDDDMDLTDDAIQLTKPARKLMKPFQMTATEASVGTNAFKCTNGDSVQSEDLKGDTDDLSGSLSMNSKKKMELKMPKKITPAKLPSNVRDLLGTGLLEGLPVKYISCIGKNVGLHGVIRGNSVLCSCTLCQGTNVVSAYQFEIHAGSTKKHPSDFIFLENGKSLRDVLKSCTGAPLDMLEAAIRNAIGPTPPKKAYVCQKCKEVFDTARTGNFALLCDSCLESIRKPSTPTSSYGVARSSKFSRKLYVHFAFDGKRFSSDVKRSSSDVKPSSSDVKPSSSDVKPSSSDVKPSSFDGKLSSSDGRPSSSHVKPSSSDVKPSSSDVKPSSSDVKPSSSDDKPSASDVKLYESDLTLSASEAKLFVSDGKPKNTSSQKKLSYGKLTRKDLGLHKLVFMDDILPQGTEVGYYVRGKRLLEGYIKDLGIFCSCCNTVVSPSQFEAHAGQGSRRKPYNYIYTSNGVSLHELSVSLSKGRKFSPTENDDLCGICADGGNLLLCDLCPRAFHKECVGLSSVPTGNWFCQYCENMRQKEKHLALNDNAIAAGRVAGVDPIEQIITRCIRIITTPENDAGVCALCRQYDFSRSGFDQRTVIICDQCEIEYHVGCLKDNGMADLKELPEGEWFCRPDCSRIHSTLHELLLQGPEPLEESDVGIIKKKLGEKGLSEDTVDIRWRLLSGKKDSSDSKLLLSQAVSIFRESFDPIVEPISGRDLIPFLVYCLNMRDQDFGGIYCMVLTVNSLVISAGLLRVLGCEVAELPIVATKKESRGLGFFQSLFSCVERLFKSLKVKHFVLPAASEAESIWTNKLGFSKVTPAQLREYAKGARPMSFQGTSMLHKPLEMASVSDHATSKLPSPPLIS